MGSNPECRESRLGSLRRMQEGSDNEHAPPRYEQDPISMLASSYCSEASQWGRKS